MAPARIPSSSPARPSNGPNSIGLDSPALSGSPSDGSAPRLPDEPLAVVGMAFKLPQDASTEESLWEMLMSKRNAMTEIPEDRVNIDAFYHPDRSRPDTLPYRGGHFLTESPSAFDAPFFTITAAEAEAMDPQQRLVLETTFHALENAGMPMDQIAGSRTSVHAGSFSDDYRRISLSEPQRYLSHACSGVANCMLSNRVSWFFNLQGASVTVDTACSSSMTALDIACQGLRGSDADTGIVIGANLMLGLELPLILSNMQFLSPDSRCYAFDHRANGYGRGEGIGVLVVRRLSTAIRAGDTIRAVIRATGSGQDGWTPGITQPSAKSQEDLIRQTYAKAGLDMSLTRYVEAHGTGTAVGDPIEATAIGSAFKHYRSPSAPMYIGSVKSNLGHLEGCSGIAGVIKTILMLEKGTLAPNANFERLNPAIDAAQLNLQVVSTAIPWPTRGLRRASVSSFGFGGANSHVILDDAYNYLRYHDLQGNHCTLPAPPSIENVTSSAPKFYNPGPPSGSPSSCASKRLLVLSAADQAGVQRVAAGFRELAGRLSGQLTPAEEAAYLDSLEYTVRHRRSILNWRSSAVIGSLHDLETLPEILSKPVKSLAAPRLAFTFTGQGAQYAGMGDGLLRFPVFVESLRRSEMFLDQLGCSWSLFDELARSKDTSRVNEPGLSQPLCTALQVAIVDLLYHFSVSPSVVVGHSSGEIAAAYAVGAIDHESACKAAYFRGLCAEELVHGQNSQGPSGMMSVGLSGTDFTPYFDQVVDNFGTSEIVIACFNSPRSITVSGSIAQIDWLSGVLDHDKVFARKLRVNIAYHSPQMHAIAGRYLELLGHLKAGSGTTGIMVSSVTGSAVSSGELQTAEYWVSNMVKPVKFSEALTAAVKEKTPRHFKAKPSGRKAVFNNILEIGPHSALKGPISDTLRQCKAEGIGYLSTLSRSAPGEDTMYSLVGSLLCVGHHVTLSRVNGDQTRTDAVNVLPHLPQYPFDHSRHYWHEMNSTRGGYRLRKHPRLDLLGTPSPDWNPIEPRWKSLLRLSEQPWIADHRIKNNILYPASGMVVMALEAAKQMIPKSREVIGFVITDTVFSRPITIPEDQEEKQVEIVLRTSTTASQKNSATWDFKIYAAETTDGDWQEKCSGTVSAEFSRPVNPVDGGKERIVRQVRDKRRLDDTRRFCTRDIDAEVFYTSLRAGGFSYGPSFQAVSSIRSNGGAMACADIGVYHWDPADFPQEHIVHPTTLDAIFQTSFVAGSDGLQKDIPAILPSRLSRLWIRGEGISRPSLETTSVCLETTSTKHKVTADAFAVEPSSGHTILSMVLEASIIDVVKTDNESSSSDGSLCYEMQWKPDIDLIGNAALSSYCEAARPDERSIDWEYYQTVDLLVMRYLVDAIGTVPESRIAKMAPPLQRYVSWATDCIERFHRGDLRDSKPSDVVWQTISADSESRDALFKKVEASDLGKLYTKVATNLPTILDGSTDALEFMFSDDKLEQWYRASNHSVTFYEPLGSLLDLLTHGNSSLKVLEVGAGTGASTEFFLAKLASNRGTAGFSRYDYTDISPVFFDKGAEVCAKYAPNVGFHVFDVEKSPADQGLALASYDVVFAASVLHATKDLEQTLRNVRSLLKPGGKLVVIEIVEETVRMSFSFGLIPGWWLGDESRRLRPWRRTPEWHELMQRSGFSGVDLEIPDFANPTHHEYSVLITTAVDGDGPPPISPPISVIVDDNDDLQMSIAGALTDVYGKTGQACRVTSVAGITEPQALEGGHWVSLCEIGEPVVSELDQDGFEKLKGLIQSAQTLLWVTSGGGDGEQDPRFHIVDGLARTACTENPRLAFVTAALQTAASSPNEIAKKVLQIFSKRLQTDNAGTESEFSERGGQICIGRIGPSPEQDVQVRSRRQVVQDVRQAFGTGPPLALTIGSVGLLDTLHFVEDTEHLKPVPRGWVEVKVDTSGVNFRDCLTALGQLEADFIGIEYSGTVSQVPEDGCSFRVGDRVAGFCQGSYQTYTRTPVELLTLIPDNLSFTDAAASLVVFSTAWYSLAVTARLSKGESVLIHSAAGGTGQAAIQVAQHLGAEVYVTAGSVEKKAFLQQQYHIPENRIFASRDLTFVDGVLRETNGRGVDVILNSLSGESLEASWECIATCGRFVEIGNRDIMAHARLPMWPFRKASTFSHVAIHVMVEENPAALLAVSKTVLDLLAQRVFFVPQPLKVFRISEVRDVFRLFQGGNNFGRMVVRMSPDDVVEARLKPAVRYHFDASRTYLIAGGLGGLGRSIALWMVERGARNLILLSRSGVRSDAAQSLIKRLEAAEVNVQAPPCDISDESDLARVLAECGEVLPPVAGCVQAAMVLRDVLLESMSFDDWKHACMPKIKGTWNLHNLLTTELDFFACLSSLSCVVGNAGQANYAAGNTYMDEVARYRVLRGQPATTINLGWVKQEGVVAENDNLQATFAKVECMPPIMMDDLYALLDYACDPCKPLSPHQVVTGLAPPVRTLHDPAALQPPWLAKRAFTPLVHAAQQTGCRTDDSNRASGPDYPMLFRQAPSADDAVQVVCRCVKLQLSRALAIAEDEIDMAVPLHAVGVDSLFGIELRNHLAKMFDADVAVFDLMGAPSAEAACSMVANRSKLRIEGK